MPQESPRTVSSGEDVWICPSCSYAVDASSLGIFADVRCPRCGSEGKAHDRINSYRIGGILGVGGMSVIYRAKDIILDRDIAIKVLNASYKDQPERVANFNRECEVMAKLRHENVVSVYSAGSFCGQFYIAMELLDGENLEISLQGGRCLAALDALKITRDVAMGLREAARVGMLHRDMKPGNIIVTKEGQAKVLDFGLARCENAQNQDEVIWATPFYTSPESLRREPEDLRTDIYALGMSLRSILTGQDDFEKPAASLEELLDKKRQLPSVRQIQPLLHPDLLDLLDRMTAFDTAKRPASYDELLQEIDELIENIRRGKRRHSLGKKQRYALAATGLLALLALGSGLATVVAQQNWLSQEQPNQQSCIKLPEPEVHALSAVAVYEKATDLFLKGDLESLPKLLLPLIEQQELDPCLRLAAAELRLAASALVNLQDESAYAKARDVWTDLAEEKAKPDPASAECYAHLLDFYHRSGAMQAQDAAKNPHLNFALAQCLLGMRRCYSDGYAAKAQEWLSQAKQLIEAQKKTDGAALLEKLEACQIILLQRQEKNSAMALDASRYQTLEKAALELEKSMKKGDLTKQQMAEKSVIREALLLKKELVQRLVHNFGESISETMEARSLQSKAKLLEKEHLADEVYSLCLIAEGKLEEGMKASPYASDPDSNAPYAQLLKEWRGRLKEAR